MPLSISIGPANDHDSTRLIDTMEQTIIGIMVWIESVYADKAYDSNRIRQYFLARRITPCIITRNFGRRKHKSFDHSPRTSVERFFAWTKFRFRKITTRYEKTAGNYLAFVYFACVLTYFGVMR